jgi:hypothetical protein
VRGPDESVVISGAGILSGNVQKTAISGGLTGEGQFEEPWTDANAWIAMLIMLYAVSRVNTRKRELYYSVLYLLLHRQGSTSLSDA